MSLLNQIGCAIFFCCAVWFAIGNFTVESFMFITLPLFFVTMVILHVTGIVLDLIDKRPL